MVMMVMASGVVVALLCLVVVAQACSDNHDDCSGWAEVGECESNSEWMRANCAKSCNACDDDVHGIDTDPSSATDSCGNADSGDTDSGDPTFPYERPMNETFLAALKTEVDTHMRAGRAVAAYHALSAAIGRWPMNQDFRGVLDRVVGVLLQQPVPGAGDLYRAKVFRKHAGASDLAQGRVVAPSINLTVFDELLDGGEVDALLALRETLEQGDADLQPLWCFAFADRRGPRALAAFLAHHGLPADAAQGAAGAAADRWTGPRRQCLRSRASRALSRELADRSIAAHSSSVNVHAGESPLVDAVSARVEARTGLRSAHGATWMFTKYAGDATYSAHNDCALTPVEGLKMDRVGTVLIYLSDVEGGGATHFTKLGVRVHPSPGRAAVWRNLRADGSCIAATEHEAERVAPRSPPKIIMQRWYHAETSLELDLRREPPRVDEYRPGQHVIVCDSPTKCRRYSEWTYYG